MNCHFSEFFLCTYSKTTYFNINHFHTVPYLLQRLVLCENDSVCYFLFSLCWRSLEISTSHKMDGYHESLTRSDSNTGYFKYHSSSFILANESTCLTTADVDDSTLVCARIEKTHFIDCIWSVWYTIDRCTIMCISSHVLWVLQSGPKLYFSNSSLDLPLCLIRNHMITITIAMRISKPKKMRRIFRSPRPLQQTFKAHNANVI